MASVKVKTEDVSVEEKLRALYTLQQVDSKIDKIKVVRGELPLEVMDCEDIVAGLETRLANSTDELKALEDSISDKKNLIKEAQLTIKKYQKQQSNVRNNREYDSITKEIEFQNLEIQLAEKRIKEYKAAIVMKQEVTQQTEEELKKPSKRLKIQTKRIG